MAPVALAHAPCTTTENTGGAHRLAALAAGSRTATLASRYGHTATTAEASKGERARGHPKRPCSTRARPCWCRRRT
eukprot:11842118-Alexandrium_andersonii.AAC.1